MRRISHSISAKTSGNSARTAEITASNLRIQQSDKLKSVEKQRDEGRAGYGDPGFHRKTQPAGGGADFHEVQDDQAHFQEGQEDDRRTLQPVIIDPAFDMNRFQRDERDQNQDAPKPQQRYIGFAIPDRNSWAGRSGAGRDSVPGSCSGFASSPSSRRI
jgi:hypothetical protein